MEDTIAAISTAAGSGGIAIIRISGSQALAVADAIFYSPRGRPSSFPSHTIHFGSIGRNGDLIDQVMLSVMHAPRTYTGEHTVEINCHGGTLTARKILALSLRNGARLAEPGEFTKRAFLNGKLDLTQAEAVMDLICAKSDRAQSAAAHALEGHLAARINQMRSSLIEVLAHLEAHIDFPEEDIAPETLGSLKDRLVSIAGEIRELLATAHDGKVLREGVRVAIVGRPNSGKSSLLNALLGEERAIVTPVAGTTRDTIEEYASIEGIPVVLTDTAGIRSARGQVEKLGVERSQKSIRRCDLILHVIDGSRAAAKVDLEIAAKYAGKMAIVVINKSDLPLRCEISKELSNYERVAISCLTGNGLDELRKSIASKSLRCAERSDSSFVAINERHELELSLANNELTDLLSSYDSLTDLALVAQKVRSVLGGLNVVSGRDVSEDVLDKIFSTFCIGK